MKRMMLIIVLVFSFIFGAYSFSLALSTCEKIAGQAEMVMQVRQQGEPSYMLRDAYNDAFDDPYSIQIGEALIRDAYSYPIEPGNREAQIMIIEFKNKWYDKCREALD